MSSYCPECGNACSSVQPVCFVCGLNLNSPCKLSHCIHHVALSSLPHTMNDCRKCILQHGHKGLKDWEGIIDNAV